MVRHSPLIIVIVVFFVIFVILYGFIVISLSLFSLLISYSSLVVRHSPLIIVIVVIFVILCGVIVIVTDSPLPSFDSLKGFEARGTPLGK